MTSRAPPEEQSFAVPPLAVVVEDDEPIRDVLMMLLEDAGYATACADSLGGARRLLGLARPSVLLLDLNLRGELAVDLLAELACAQDAPPTLLISASIAAPSVAQRFGIELAAKPFDIDALFVSIDRTRKGHRRPLHPAPVQRCDADGVQPSSGPT